jgi:hypothetical protein
MLYASRAASRTKTVRSLAFHARSPRADCPRRARTSTLAPQSKNKRPETLARSVRAATTGDDVNSFSYLPATFTTLFVLAASLLLGYLQ